MLISFHKYHHLYILIISIRIAFGKMAKELKKNPVSHAGYPLALAGAMVGHKSEQTMKRYAHLYKLQALKKAFDR
jgi:hypothetical protein